MRAFRTKKLLYAQTQTLNLNDFLQEITPPIDS